MFRKRIAKTLVFTILTTALLFSPETRTRAEETTSADGHEHKYTETVIVQGSCTEDGETLYECECGDSYTVKEVAAGHFFGNWYVETPSTVDKAGIEYRTCYVCGAKETREMATLTPTPTPTATPKATATPKPTKEPTATPVPTHKPNTVYKVSGTDLQETIYNYLDNRDYAVFKMPEGSYIEFLNYPKGKLVETSELNEYKITDCYATWQENGAYVYVITTFSRYNYYNKYTLQDQHVLRIKKSDWPRFQRMFERGYILDTYKTNSKLDSLIKSIYGFMWKN